MMHPMIPRIFAAGFVFEPVLAKSMRALGSFVILPSLAVAW